jgi:hypothetical protein
MINLLLNLIVRSPSLTWFVSQVFDSTQATLAHLIIGLEDFTKLAP